MLGMTTTEDAISVGVREISEALGGGIREGSLVFIEGEAKAGKSVLSQYITYGILCSRDCAVAYYPLDSNVKDLATQMDSISLGIKDDLAADRLRVCTLHSEEGFKDVEGYLRLITKHISNRPERFKLVIVDSVAPFMARLSPMKKVDFLQEYKELCEQDRSIILTLDTHVFEERTLARAYAMSDYYLKLKSQDMILDRGQVDTRVIKILDVTKLGGAERRAQGDIKFEIKPRVGIQILPLVNVRI